MDTIRIDQSEPQSISITERVLLAGGVIAIPTDTVYGIACLVTKPRSIQRLYAIKDRDLLKAIPVLVSSYDQVQKIAIDIPSTAHKLADHFWPGALTLIVKKQPSLPDELTIYPTVGIRMPDHSWLQSLMENCGPLAATSANMSGDPSLATADEVMNSLGGKLNLLVDGGTCEGGIPSTVVDCSVPQIKILREGGIPATSILKMFENTTQRE